MRVPFAVRGLQGPQHPGLGWEPTACAPLSGKPPHSTAPLTMDLGTHQEPQRDRRRPRLRLAPSVLLDSQLPKPTPPNEVRGMGAVSCPPCPSWEQVPEHHEILLLPLESIIPPTGGRCGATLNRINPGKSMSNLRKIS